jgi:polysaccharide biosynthesis transport protein
VKNITKVHRVPDASAVAPIDVDFHTRRLANSADPAAVLETEGLLDYVFILWRNWRILCIAGLLGGLAAILVTLPQTPVYRSRASLEIQGMNNDFLNGRQINPVSDESTTSTADIQTQIKIIGSEFLIDRVVSDLRKNQPPPSPDSQHQVSWWRRLFHKGPPKQVEFTGDFRWTALKNLSVSQLGQTRMVEIYFKSPDPKLSADFVNLLNSNYIEANVEARWKMSEQTGMWLSRQINDVRSKLEDSEQLLHRYARQAGLLFASNGGATQDNVSDEKLQQMQDELSKAESARIQAESRYEVAKSSPEMLAEVLHDQSLRDLQRQITDLRRQAADLSSIYTDQNEKVERVRAQIGPLEAALETQRMAILNGIRSDYEGAVGRENLLKTAYDSQVAVVLDQGDKSIQYNTLKRDVDTNRQLYESMLQQVKAASVASAMRASNIRIVDPAKVPTEPYSPNFKINTGLGGIAGFVFGTVFVLVRKNTDRTLKQPGEVQGFTQISELGVIPSESYLTPRAPWWNNAALERRAVSGPVRRLPPSDSDAPNEASSTVLTEAFRMLLTSVLFSGTSDTRPRVLAVTSVNPSEGKTMVTANLAVALAEVRQRVLVIDGDLRKPNIHDLFELPNNAGLSSLLAREALKGEMIKPLIQRTQVKGLSILTSGPPTMSSGTLLHSPHLQLILSECRKNFDMILIDTPPSIHLTDSRVIGRVADGVLLVTRAGQTRREEVLSVASRFSDDGTRLVGSILNDWTPHSRSHGAYYDYPQRRAGQESSS